MELLKKLFNKTVEEVQISEPSYVAVDKNCSTCNFFKYIIDPDGFPFLAFKCNVNHNFVEPKAPSCRKWDHT